MCFLIEAWASLFNGLLIGFHCLLLAPNVKVDHFLKSSQVTYEIQPPSYTALKLLTGPLRGGGGDTLWSSQYAVYDLLSPGMQKYLESLSALHSAQIQANGSNALGRTVRRNPVTTKHPLIRTHPVTGWKSVFFNPGFVTEIVGVPKAEGNAIIGYLNELVSTTQEAHVRFQWQKNDVAFWDNRICVSLVFTLSTSSDAADERLRTTQPPTALLPIVATQSVSPSMPNVLSSMLRAEARKRKRTLVMVYRRSIKMALVRRTTMTERVWVGHLCDLSWLVEVKTEGDAYMVHLA